MRFSEMKFEGEHNIKKRTSRLLSVLLTLVMVLGLLPALGTTALADERFDLYLGVGENAFDKPEIQSIIYRLTGQHAKGHCSRAQIVTFLYRCLGK